MESRRLLDQLHAQRVEHFARIRRHRFRVIRDEILLHPRGPRLLHAQFRQPLLRVVQERLRQLHRRRSRVALPRLAHIVVRLGLRLLWLLFRRSRLARILCRHNGRGRNAANRNSNRQPSPHPSHAPALCVCAATSCKTTRAPSIPSRFTSTCVTNRTEYSAVSCAQIPCRYSASHNSTAAFPIPEQSKITMLLRTFAALICNPRICAIPSASRRAFS